MSGIPESAITEIATCRECSSVHELAEVATCPDCGSNQIRRGAEFLWTPWDSHGLRMDGFKVRLFATKARRSSTGQHLDVLCEAPDGSGERWFRLRYLLE